MNQKTADAAPENLSLSADQLAAHIAREAVGETGLADNTTKAHLGSGEGFTLRMRISWFLRRCMRRAYRLPGVGYCARLFMGVVMLPRYLDQLQRVANQISDLHSRTEMLNAHIQDLNRLHSGSEMLARLEDIEDFRIKAGSSMEEIYEAFDRLQNDLADVAGRSDEVYQTLPGIKEDVVHLKRAFADLQRQALSTAATAPTQPSPAAAVVPQEHASAVPEALDLIYMGLEQRFRGDEASVAERQKVYLEPLAKAMAEGRSNTLLDLGCGRGEFMRLVQEQGYKAEGIDLNSVAVAEAQEAGLSVTRKDAIAALQERADASLAAISVFQLIEHLPFPALAQMVLEARRVLEPGGLLILETPNPDNLSVGANTFWLDPTHKAPIPSRLAAYLCEIQGFEKVDVMPLNPFPLSEEHHPDPMVERINQALYGPQDYAILAWA